MAEAVQEYEARMAQLNVLERGTAPRPGTAGDIRAYIDRLIAHEAALAAELEAVRQNSSYGARIIADAEQAHARNRGLTEALEGWRKVMDAALLANSIQSEHFMWFLALTMPDVAIQTRALLSSQPVQARDEELERLREALRPFEDTRVTGGQRPGLWRCPLCRQCSDQPHAIDHSDGCKARAALLAEARDA